MNDEYTSDGFLDNRLTIKQPRQGFRSGHDAVFLAASVAPTARAVCELGCGAGVASLCVAARVPEARIIGIDIEPHWVELATQNAAANESAARVQFLCGDVAGAFAALALTANQFDTIIANPPYYKQGQIAPPPHKERAYIGDDLAAWVKCAAALLAAKGHVIFIYPAPAVPELLAALTPRFGDIHLLPLMPRAGVAAHRVLVRARRDSKAPLTLLPPLVLQDAQGQASPAATAITRHGETLAFSPLQG